MGKGFGLSRSRYSISKKVSVYNLRDRLSEAIQVHRDHLKQRLFQKGLVVTNIEPRNTREMQQVVEFMLEVDRLKAVTRKVRPAGLDRYENSAEHSWQIALFAASLAPYADGPLDLDRVIRMLLVHDLGEIDTGDTIVFAREGWQERKSAERVAVERMFADASRNERRGICRSLGRV